MSDQPDSGPLPELTPEQESTVRRLLAEARHDEPLPAEVGERLDRVLAGLARETESSAGPVAPVVDLAARRRRRNVAVLMAGAAAVIVAGFGIGQVIDVGGTSGTGADAQSASTASDRRNAEAQGLSGDSGGSRTSPQSSDQSSTPSLQDPSDATVPGPSAVAAGTPLLRLRSARLGHDVATQVGSLDSAYRSTDSTSGALSAYDCTPATAGSYGQGELFPALYDDQRAVLVLRPTTGASQQAVVLACGSGTEVDSATVPTLTQP